METRYRDSKSGQTEEDGNLFQDLCHVALLVELGWPVHVFKSKWFQTKISESTGLLEIKYDSGMSKYNHPHVEVAERTDTSSPWHPSGIYSPSVFYLQGDLKTAFLFSTKHLLRIHKSGKYKDENPWPTITTFTIPWEDAQIACVYQFSFQHIEMRYTDVLGRWSKHLRGGDA